MLFDLFSKRNKPLPDVFQYDELPAQFRVQVAWIWSATVGKFDDTYRGINPIWIGVRNAVCAEYGRGNLAGSQDAGEDLHNFLQKSKEVPVVLDIIELSFRILYEKAANDHNYRLRPQEFIKAIETLNHRFRENGVGYEFNSANLRLIRVDNMAIHQNAVQPALAVLTAKQYKHANQELLEAFDDYKKGDYDDCLVKCCASMESVLKVIHKTKKWSFVDSAGAPPKMPIENATAGPLITSYIKNSNLPNFFDQPLTVIATLRNRLSTAHGQGTSAKDVPEHFARYALNATTSAILLLDEHAK